MRILQCIALATVIASGVFGFGASALAQAAQTFPHKPVRIVVPFSPGSPTDIMARMIAPKLNERWGQPVVVDNRPGAGGTLAAALVAQAPPDGHTLLFAGTSFVIGAALIPNLPYDPVKDFSGVTQTGFPAAVLVVAPTLGIKSAQDLIAYGKAHPGRLILGSAGAGSASHLNGERIRLAAGIQVVHVGFKGQPELLIQIIGGRVHYTVAGFGPALPLIKDGRLSALAVLLPQRSPLLPEVPGITEVLPGFERSESGAVLAPAHTPRGIREQISQAFSRVLALAEIRDRMQAIGFVVASSTPEEHETILRAQLATLSRLVRDAGLRPK